MGVDDPSRGWRSGFDPQSDITVTRRTDTRAGARREAVAVPDGQFMLGVALASTRIRLLSGPEMIFDGVMASGMTYVCRPAQTLHAEFAGPTDFLHLYVAGDSTREPRIAPTRMDVSGDAVLATVLCRDALIDHLARALHAVGEDADERYVETMVRAIAMRTSQLSQRPARVLPLQPWRLKRVVDYIQAHVSRAIALDDIAAAAGLSRMHFAAQFRLATGYKPHDFVLLQRIEVAKRLLLDAPGELVDVALSVGFQAQAHFSTVFKRFVGETPGRWRRMKLAELRGGARDAIACPPSRETP